MFFRQPGRTSLEGGPASDGVSAGLVGPPRVQRLDVLDLDVEEPRYPLLQVLVGLRLFALLLGEEDPRRHDHLVRDPVFVRPDDHAGEPPRLGLNLSQHADVFVLRRLLSLHADGRRQVLACHASSFRISRE